MKPERGGSAIEYLLLVSMLGIMGFGVMSLKGSGVSSANPGSVVTGTSIVACVFSQTLSLSAGQGSCSCLPENHGTGGSGAGCE